MKASKKGRLESDLHETGIFLFLTLVVFSGAIGIPTLINTSPSFGYDRINLTPVTTYYQEAFAEEEQRNVLSKYYYDPLILSALLVLPSIENNPAPDPLQYFELKYSLPIQLQYGFIEFDKAFEDMFKAPKLQEAFAVDYTQNINETISARDGDPIGFRSIPFYNSLSGSQDNQTFIPTTDFGQDGFYLGTYQGTSDSGGATFQGEIEITSMSLHIGDATNITSGTIQAVILSNVTNDPSYNTFEDNIIEGVSSNSYGFPIEQGIYTFYFDPPVLVDGVIDHQTFIGYTWLGFNFTGDGSNDFELSYTTEALIDHVGECRGITHGSGDAWNTVANACGGASRLLNYEVMAKIVTPVKEFVTDGGIAPNNLVIYQTFDSEQEDTTYPDGVSEWGAITIQSNAGSFGANASGVGQRGGSVNAGGVIPSQTGGKLDGMISFQQSDSFEFLVSSMEHLNDLDFLIDNETDLYGLSFWVNVIEYGAPPFRVFTTMEENGSFDQGVKIIIEENTRIRVDIATNNNLIVSNLTSIGLPPIQVGTWTLVGIAVNKTDPVDTVRLYINGTEEASQSADFSTGITIPNNLPIHFGFDGAGGTIAIDDFGVWKDYLPTEDDMSDLYNGGDGQAISTAKQISGDLQLLESEIQVDPNNVPVYHSFDGSDLLNDASANFGLDGFYIGQLGSGGVETLNVTSISFLKGQSSSFTSGSIQAVILSNVTDGGLFDDIVVERVSDPNDDIDLADEDDSFDDEGIFTFQFTPPVEIDDNTDVFFGFNFTGDGVNALELGFSSFSFTQPCIGVTHGTGNQWNSTCPDGYIQMEVKSELDYPIQVFNETNQNLVVYHSFDSDKIVTFGDGQGDALANSGTFNHDASAIAFSNGNAVQTSNYLVSGLLGDAISVEPISDTEILIDSMATMQGDEGFDSQLIPQYYFTFDEFTEKWGTSFWINGTWSSIASGDYAPIISSVGNEENGIRIMVDDVEQIVVDIFNSETGAIIDTFEAGTTLNDSEWYQIGFTLDKNGEAKIYVNGVETANTSGFDFFSDPNQEFIDLALTIGEHIASTTAWSSKVADPIDFLMDDLCIWKDYEPTASDMDTIYNGGTGEVCTVISSETEDTQIVMIDTAEEGDTSLTPFEDLGDASAKWGQVVQFNNEQLQNVTFYSFNAEDVTQGTLTARIWDDVTDGQGDGDESIIATGSIYDFSTGTIHQEGDFVFTLNFTDAPVLSGEYVVGVEYENIDAGITIDSITGDLSSDSNTRIVGDQCYITTAGVWDICLETALQDPMTGFDSEFVIAKTVPLTESIPNALHGSNLVAYWTFDDSDIDDDVIHNKGTLGNNLDGTYLLGDPNEGVESDRYIATPELNSSSILGQAIISDTSSVAQAGILRTSDLLGFMTDNNTENNGDTDYWSMSFWVLGDFTDGGSDVYQPIISNGIFEDDGFSIGTNENGEIGVALLQGGNEIFGTDTFGELGLVIPSDGNFHLISLTIDKVEEELNICVDGSSNCNNTGSANSFNTFFGSNFRPLTIAEFSTQLVIEPSNGGGTTVVPDTFQVDDLGIWQDYLLTNTDIDNLWNNGTGSPIGETPSTSDVDAILFEFGRFDSEFDEGVDAKIGHQITLDNQKVTTLTFYAVDDADVTVGDLTGYIWNNIIDDNSTTEEGDEVIVAVSDSYDFATNGAINGGDGEGYITLNFTDAPFLTGDYVLGLEISNIDNPVNIRGTEESPFDGGNSIFSEEQACAFTFIGGFWQDCFDYINFDTKLLAGEIDIKKTVLDLTTSSGIAIDNLVGYYTFDTNHTEESIAINAGTFGHDANGHNLADIDDPLAVAFIDSVGNEAYKNWIDDEGTSGDDFRLGQTIDFSGENIERVVFDDVTLDNNVDDGTLQVIIYSNVTLDTTELDDAVIEETSDIFFVNSTNITNESLQFNFTGTPMLNGTLAVALVYIVDNCGTCTALDEITTPVRQTDVISGECFFIGNSVLFSTNDSGEECEDLSLQIFEENATAISDTVDGDRYLTDIMLNSSSILGQALEIDSTGDVQEKVMHLSTHNHEEQWDFFANSEDESSSWSISFWLNADLSSVLEDESVTILNTMDSGQEHGMLFSFANANGNDLNPYLQINSDDGLHTEPLHDSIDWISDGNFHLITISVNKSATTDSTTICIDEDCESNDKDEDYESADLPDRPLTIGEQVIGNMPDFPYTPVVINNLQVDDLCIWKNYLLNSTDIEYLYNEGSGNTCATVEFGIFVEEEPPEVAETFNINITDAISVVDESLTDTIPNVESVCDSAIGQDFRIVCHTFDSDNIIDSNMTSFNTGTLGTLGHATYLENNATVAFNINSTGKIAEAITQEGLQSLDDQGSVVLGTDSSTWNALHSSAVGYNVTSINFWVNGDVIGAPAYPLVDTTHNRMVAPDESSALTGMTFYIEGNTEPQYYFAVSEANGTRQISGTIPNSLLEPPPDDGQWHMVTLVYNLGNQTGSPSPQFFSCTDAVCKSGSSNPVSITPSTGAINPATYNLTLGSGEDHCMIPFNCPVSEITETTFNYDDFAIWNGYQLTQEDIIQLYGLYAPEGDPSPQPLEEAECRIENQGTLGTIADGFYVTTFDDVTTEPVILTNGSIGYYAYQNGTATGGTRGEIRLGELIDRAQWDFLHNGNVGFNKTSINIWVRGDLIGSPDYSILDNIIYDSDDPEESDGFFMGTRSATGFKTRIFEDGILITGNTVQGVSPPDDGNWHMLSLMMDKGNATGTNMTKICLDGSSNCQNFDLQNPFTGNGLTADHTLAIGTWHFTENNGATDNEYDVDDVTIWQDYILTSTDIDAMYANGTGSSAGVSGESIELGKQVLHMTFEPDTVICEGGNVGIFNPTWIDTRGQASSTTNDSLETEVGTTGSIAVPITMTGEMISSLSLPNFESTATTGTITAYIWSNITQNSTPEGDEVIEQTSDVWDFTTMGTFDSSNMILFNFTNPVPLTGDYWIGISWDNIDDGTFIYGYSTDLSGGNSFLRSDLCSVTFSGTWQTCEDWLSFGLKYFDAIVTKEKEVSTFETISGIETDDLVVYHTFDDEQIDDDVLLNAGTFSTSADASNLRDTDESEGFIGDRYLYTVEKNSTSIFGQALIKNETQTAVHIGEEQDRLYNPDSGDSGYALWDFMHDDLTDKWSMSFWLMGDMDGANVYPVISSNSGGNGMHFGFKNNKPFFELIQAGSSRISTDYSSITGFPDDGNFHLVTVSVQKSNVTETTLVCVDTSCETKDYNSPFDNSSSHATRPLTIGEFANNLVTQPNSFEQFQMDDLCIWKDVVLTASQRSFLYNSGDGSTCAVVQAVEGGATFDQDEEDTVTINDDELFIINKTQSDFVSILDEENFNITKARSDSISTTDLVNKTVVPTPASPPSAPLNLLFAGFAGSSNNVKLEWTESASGNPTSYVIERRVGSGGSFVVLNPSCCSNEQYTDNTTLPSTEYHYRVAGINGAGQGVYSNIVVVVTKGVPASPVLTAVQNVNQIDLSWNTPKSSEPITGYKIDKRTNLGSFITLVPNTGSTATTYSDLAVIKPNTYGYRVSGISSLGTGAVSNVVDVVFGSHVIVQVREQDGSGFKGGGVVEARNSTFSQLVGLNSLSNAIFNNLDGTFNYTFFDNSDFILNKTINFPFPSGNSTSTFTINALVFDVNCPSNGAGTDVRIKVNYTDSKDIFSFPSIPVCDSTDQISWSTRWTGGSTPDSSIMVADFISNFFKANALQFLVSSVITPTTYSSPANAITSNAFDVNSTDVTINFNLFMARAPAGGGGGSGGQGSGDTTPPSQSIPDPEIVFANQLTDLSLLSRTHQFAQAGDIIEGSVTVQWDGEQNMKVIGIEVGEFNGGTLRFATTAPFDLEQQIEGIGEFAKSNAEVPYTIVLNQDECNPDIGLTQNCFNPILHSIPIEFTFGLGDQEYQASTEVFVDGRPIPLDIVQLQIILLFLVLIASAVFGNFIRKRFQRKTKRTVNVKKKFRKKFDSS